MVVVVTTCALRGDRYLRALVAQVDGAGGWSGPRFIVSDGPPPFDAGWPTDATAAPAGQKSVYWRALACGLENARAGGATQFLVLEDDIELCDGALPSMARATVPAGLEFLSWFDGHAVPPGAAPGIHPVPAARFVCLQAVTWPVATAATLLASPKAAAWRDPHRGDVLIGSILTGRRYGVHVPNLVEHRGAESLCSPGQTLTGLRTAANPPPRS